VRKSSQPLADSEVGAIELLLLVLAVGRGLYLRVREALWRTTGPTPGILASRRQAARAYSCNTVTFFIQTFFKRDKVYTNFLYTGQSLYGAKFIQDKVYTGTKFI
jgi:hypothetical protein